MILLVGRFLAAMALAMPAWALPPHVVLGGAEPEINLVPRMSVHRLAPGDATDPDRLWALPPGPPSTDEGLQVADGITVVGRARLEIIRSHGVFVVQVPSSRVDHVQLWYRIGAAAWRSAEAGDTVPLARWPFYGQYPAFSIVTHEQEVDLIVMVRNSGTLRVPVWLKTEKAFQEGRLRQANVSGLVMGMGLMVAVVTLISAVTLRLAASWVLVGFSLWSVLTVCSVNGYAAIWLLPDWPMLNDGGKHFTAVVLSATMLWSVSVLVDRAGPQALLRWLGPGMTLLAALYGLVQLLWLPGWLRLPGALWFSGACVALAGLLCLMSWRRGGRYVGLIGCGVLAYTGVVLLGAESPSLRHGLDLRSAGAASLLFGGALLWRHAQFSRERYGRDVLGRAAVSANRDPLTALLSFAGLQQSLAQAVLREGAGQGMASMLMFVLPRLDRSSAQHGFVLTERALVRFAANLQDLLGRDWSVGRLDKSHFCAISLRESMAEGLIDLCARVLARCLRDADPLGAVTDFDLRIVCRVRGVAEMPLPDLLRHMEDAARSLPAGKRIALV
ncbi:MAG TPA: 7TM diverse intracellular signaling domain-containing protein [Ramlibacter sp.]|nr:7TM diverse intracellular signaling domain-containing protein [Ramlibacter sp.]